MRHFLLVFVNSEHSLHIYTFIDVEQYFSRLASLPN